MYNSRATRPTSGVGTGLSSSSDPLQASGMGGGPLQGPGNPWAVLLFCRQPLQWQHRNLTNWKQWTEWQLSCQVWNATRFFRFWFHWPWGPSAGILYHSSRPSDGTDAALTDVANPRGYGSFMHSATDTYSSAELYRPA